MILDEIDKKLLSILQRDAKTNIKELSKEVNLTKTPIYERIKRYERDGLIDRYVAIVDQEKIETGMVVFCSVSLESQKLENIEAFGNAVSELGEIAECYLMGGSSDFLLKVLVKDLQAYHQFSSGKLARLPNVSQIKSQFVLNEIKRTTEVPVYDALIE